MFTALSAPARGGAASALAGPSGHRAIFVGHRPTLQPVVHGSLVNDAAFQFVVETLQGQELDYALLATRASGKRPNGRFPRYYYRCQGIT